MPTSDNRHPSRDALLRDGLGQLKTQRGVSLDSFALTLNDIVHAAVPHKLGGQPAIRSFTTLEDAARVMSSWRKRVERWFTDPEDGGTEIPAWLEEPWVQALEEHGDTETRVALVRRHGYLGVSVPRGGMNHTGVASAIGSLSREHGEAIVAISRLVEMPDLSLATEEQKAAIRKELKDVIASATGAIALLDSKKSPLKAVQ